MADNFPVTPGAGASVATDLISGNHYQRVKIQVGGDGVATDAITGAGLPVSPDSAAFDVAVSFTRPANMTPYTAGDVVGATAAALTFAAIGPSAGAVMITGVQLEADIAAVPSGMSAFRLYLYNVTPPSALADNAAWDLPSGDRASFLGYLDIPLPADLGSTLYVEVANINKQVRLAGTALYAYLVTTAGFTPAANSEVYKVTLHTQAV